MPRTVSRAEWGASRPKGQPTRVEPSRRTEFVVHYSTGEELGHTDCAAWVREIQAFHQGPERGWSDVGYNFLVCRHGEVFEGRGWDVVGAHAPGHNTSAVGVCFLGDDDPGQDVPEVAREAIRALWFQLTHRAGHPITRLGHRDTKETGCPGDELWRWVHDGMPVKAHERPAQPAPKPAEGEGPRPPKFPSGGPMRRTKRPTKSARVQQWQQRMSERGWKLTVDGVYGEESERVCRAFQTEKRLRVTGVVDETTWNAAWVTRVT